MLPKVTYMTHETGGDMTHMKNVLNSQRQILQTTDLKVNRYRGPTVKTSTPLLEILFSYLIL
jgi:hypothetical protein